MGSIPSLLAPLLADYGASAWDRWLSLGNVVATLVVGVAAVAATVWAVVRGRATKRLTYELVSNASIVNVNKDLGEPIKVSLDGEEHEISEARILIVRLTNTGNTTIEREDFCGQGLEVRFAFRSNAVLRCGVQSIVPGDNFDEDMLKSMLKIGPDRQHVSLVPLPLMPKTCLTIKILIRENVEMRVLGHITGGSLVRAKPVQRWPVRGTAVAGIAVGIVLANTFPTISASLRGECAFGEIRVGGSSAFGQTVATAAKEYRAACPVSSIHVSPYSSGEGLRKLRDGDLDIANSELPLDAVDREIAAAAVSEPISIVPFVIILNLDVTGVTDLSSRQLRQIYGNPLDGGQRAMNWQEFGGPDLPIHVVGRASTSSGTRVALSRYVLGPALELRPDIVEQDSTPDLVKQVRETSGAIGYVGLKTAQDSSISKVKIVTIDGRSPTPGDVKSDSYKFWAIERMYTKPAPAPLVTSFSNFVRSKIREEANYIDTADLNAEIRRRHE